MQTFDRLMAQALHRAQCFPYYFLEAFKLVRPYVGDQVLKDHFGDRWAKVNLKFIELAAIAGSVKSTFERLKKDENITNPQFREYLYARSQLLMSPLITEAFVVICENSNLGRHNIDHQAFKDQMLKPYHFGSNRGERYDQENE